MSLPRPAVFVLGVVTALILGGTAYAANGGSLIIGRINQGTAQTSLSNPNGSAMEFDSKAGTPSIKVNRKTKVLNLNADLFDNLDSTQLALKSGKTGMILGTSTDSDSDAATAICPTGTSATGGGGIATGTPDYLWYSGPIINMDGTLVPNSWMALADGASVAWLVCYNPRGAVPGAVTSLAALKASGAFASSAHQPFGK